MPTGKWTGGKRVRLTDTQRHGERRDRKRKTEEEGDLRPRATWGPLIMSNAFFESQIAMRPPAVGETTHNTASMKVAPRVVFCV